MKKSGGINPPLQREEPVERNNSLTAIEMAEFQRKPNRLRAESYRGRKPYFLTLCTAKRKELFENPVLVNALLAALRETCCVYLFRVYAYCFMPDHLHLILVGETHSSDLALLMRAFKGAATAAARRAGVSNLWQKGFYDHVLRDGRALDEAAWYVFMNPVRAGLAKRAEEWPHSGSFMFEWKNITAPSMPFVPPWKSRVAR